MEDEAMMIAPEIWLGDRAQFSAHFTGDITFLSAQSGASLAKSAIVRGI
jgi:hypothetical protein